MVDPRMAHPTAVQLKMKAIAAIRLNMVVCVSTLSAATPNVPHPIGIVKYFSLQSTPEGFKANYFDVEFSAEYWISGCKKGGHDRLYPGLIEIDPDVREEYWKEIRALPQKIDQASI